MARRYKPAPVSYKPAHRYTADELKAAAIADLLCDLRCAERDGLTDYAAKCRAQLDAMQKTAAGTDWARWIMQYSAAA